MNQPPRVLLVDDDRGARATLRALLRPEGYHLDVAVSGVEALALLDDELIEPPDAVLLDVMMPEIDGFEVCRRLRQDARFAHLPVILITALDSKEDLARGLEAGADDFLSKPVNRLELRARLRSMLRIKDQYDRLTASLALREEMASMIVHDLRGPLFVIRGHLELLAQEGQAPAELRPTLHRLVDEADQMSSLLHDMLTLAKLEGGRLEPRRQRLDLAALVRAAAERLRDAARLWDAEVVAELPPEPLWADVDANLLRRVIDNLVENALRHTAAGTVVTVGLSEAPEEDTGRARLTVRDHGPGVPEELREAIFDKYRALAARTRGSGGFGLGLAFVRQAVEAHGGAVRVVDADGGGALFVVDL